MREIIAKRIYLPAQLSDGYRVLVDRLWPRGMAKERAAIDLWCKEIAPTDHLRKWFNHQPENWPQFRKQYREELLGQAALLQQLLELAPESNLTLLYSAKDTQHNQAIVLQEVLKSLSEAGAG